MTTIIREPRTKADFESLSNLAKELAKYHQENKHPDPQKLMSDTTWYSSRLISVDGIDVGFVGWHKLYACQSAERSIELQNLFVNEQYRSHSLGLKLVLEVVRDALKLECTEIKIGLRKENTLALEFYKKLGCSIADRNDIWRCKLSHKQMQEIIAKLEHEAE